MTEYPSADELESLTVDLLAECDGSSEISGEGRDGPEAAGMTDYWGATRTAEKRVHVVNPR